MGGGGRGGGGLPVPVRTGTRCRIRRSRASQTCSMGEMSGEYAGHAKTGMFSASRNCVQILATRPCIIILQHEVMVVDEWHNNGPQDLVMVSLWIQNGINKMHLCSLSITYACPYHNPYRHHGPLDPQRWVQQTAHPQTPYTLSAICPVQWKPGFIREENTSPKCQTPSNVWAFAHSSLLRRWTAVRLRPRWGRRACRWASLRRFLTVCAENL